MKEVKFKVWDKVRLKMLKPHAITFDTQTLAPFAVCVPGRSWEPSLKFELLQWTGLSDVHGVDVYENDFIKIAGVTYKVIWNKSKASFTLVDPGNSSDRNISDVGIGEIAGNPYQNVSPLTSP